MIFQLTPEEVSILREIEERFNKIIAEKEEQSQRYKAPDHELEMKDPDPPIRPIRPKTATKSAIEEYNKALAEYNEKVKQHNEQVNRNYEEWLNSASPEWRQIRNELLDLDFEKAREQRAVISGFARRRFSELQGDKQKILAHAEDQARQFIRNRYEYYKKIAETGIVDGDQVTAFMAIDLRVGKNNSEMWLDAIATAENIREELKLHFDALKDDHDGTQRLEKIIMKEVKGSPYVSGNQGTRAKYLDFNEKPKRKPRSRKNLPAFVDDVDQKFFMFSTTPAKDVVFNLLASDGDVLETAQMINAVSKKNQAKIHRSENSRAIQVDSPNAQTVVEILGSAFTKINSRTAKKILHLIESEIYQRIYYKGRMNDGVIEFPLQKMIDLKLYTSLQNARRAFYDAGNVLTAIRISGSLKSGKKEFSIGEGNERYVLFPTMKVENGQCFVRLNSDIDWTPFLKDFFLMPDSWWSLPDNASDLEYKIFRLIRLHKDQVDQDGNVCFKVNLSSVASWLNLPLKTKNPKHNVKDPIETAVRQISESLDSKCFRIKLVTDQTAPLAQYLNGHLEITVSGAYTQNLIGLNEKRHRLIERNARRKSEIIKEASVRKLTEEMKNDDPGEQKIAD